MRLKAARTVSGGLAGDARQVDHHARLVTSIHASWPGGVSEARRPYRIWPPSTSVRCASSAPAR
jgi:hypothetical protein